MPPARDWVMQLNALPNLATSARVSVKDDASWTFWNLFSRHFLEREVPQQIYFWTVLKSCLLFFANKKKFLEKQLSHVEVVMHVVVPQTESLPVM